MFNDDEPLDDKPSWNHVFEDISLKSQEEDETLPPAIETDYYTRPTESLTTRKTRYTTVESTEIMLEDMKNKKIFQRAKEESKVRNMLEGLSYDEDLDDDEVTMYRAVFSHEKTTITTKRTPNRNKGGRPKHKTTLKLTTVAGITNTTEQNVNPSREMETLEDYSEYSDIDDNEPKQITSQEQNLYEYYVDLTGNNQTIFKRGNTTEKGVYKKTILVPVGNTTDKVNLKTILVPLERRDGSRDNISNVRRKRKRKTRVRKIQTTTEFKMLSTDNISHTKFMKLKKKYDNLDIGKLPNTTKEKEIECLEKEILHIFNVESMKSFVSDLFHYYKHYQSHFNDVINLVQNSSIFNIETDGIENCDTPNTRCTINLFPTTHVNSKNGILHMNIFTEVSSTTASSYHLRGQNVISNTHLNDKFDLAALNDLFKNEKKIVTDYDRSKYDKIYFNLRKILHCLKLNLNMKKYNFINEPNINDLMNIILKHKQKYDDSAYVSEYEELYYMAKTMDYYPVSDAHREDYEYDMNKHSGVEEEGPPIRNLENQEVIKQAFRNMSRLRQERHEFECGILEGQVKNKCHYCGKNYSQSNEYRYMKHVHNHILDELEGPDYLDGLWQKDVRCLEKAMSYMTKPTITTYPTIDVYPYYENVDSNELAVNLENEYLNRSTKGFEYFVRQKKRQDEREKQQAKLYKEKAERYQRDHDLEHVRKILDRKDFVTFSDESLPVALKRFIKNYGNETGLNAIQGENVGEDNDQPKEGNQFEDILLKSGAEDQQKSKENILGKFQENREKQDEYRINELKQAANELLKHKDWRSRLQKMNQRAASTTEMDVEEREVQVKKVKKMQRQRYQSKLLKEKEEREMQQMWYQENMNVDKWVFKKNVWTTLVPQ